VSPLTDEQLKEAYLSKEQQVERIHQHLTTAGKFRDPTESLRVFVAVHHVNWEEHGLVDPWADIAEVSHYDWGHSFNQYSRDWHEKGKPALNSELLRRVEQVYTEKPIDLFFSYLSGRWVYPRTIRAIGKMGPITVNISFDDTMKFWGYREPSGLSGNAEIAPEFDICITCQSPCVKLKGVAFWSTI